MNFFNSLSSTYKNNIRDRSFLDHLEIRVRFPGTHLFLPRQVYISGGEIFHRFKRCDFDLFESRGRGFCSGVNNRWFRLSTYALLGVHQALIVPPPGNRGRWPGAGSDADQLVPLARRQRLVRPDYPHLQRPDCKCSRLELAY